VGGFKLDGGSRLRSTACRAPANARDRLDPPHVRDTAAGFGRLALMLTLKCNVKIIAHGSALRHNPDITETWERSPAYQSAIPLFDQTKDCSFVPAGIRTAGPRSGSGEPASDLIRGRPPGQRDCALPRGGGEHIDTLSADPFASFIAEASQRFGMPGRWIRAVMHAESGSRPRETRASSD
jgi:hypothetical protein